MRPCGAAKGHAACDHAYKLCSTEVLVSCHLALCSELSRSCMLGVYAKHPVSRSVCQLRSWVRAL